MMAKRACKRLTRTLATTMALCAMVGMAHAVDYRTEYVKKINASQDIGVLGEALGGDRINLFTGTVEFAATDVSIPGNFALPVSVGRRYAVEPSRMLAQTSMFSSGPILRAFGDWDIDIPYLTGTFSSANGWEIDSTTPSARCSVTTQTKADGSAASGSPRQDVLYSFEFWHGNQLHLPGGGDQTMLKPYSTNTNRPTTGGVYHWTTNQSWWFSCLPGTKNNAGGEAFVAISPEGTKYTFDWLSSRFTSPATKNYLDGLGARNNKVQLRKDVFMLPSQIVDRFGNTVTFAYSSDAFAKLLSITASDGRKITLTYNASGYVDTISDGTRIWRYEYTSGRLTRVVLPDDSPSHPSAWQYSFATLETMLAENGDVCTVVTSTYDCYGEPQMTLDADVIAGYLIHPSGARVDYSFQSQFHIGAYPGNTTYIMGLSQKTISGPGIPSATWRYSFSPNQWDGKAACMAGACPTRIWTDALNPDGSLTRQLYNFDGQLLQVLQGEQTASGNSSPPIPHSLRGSDIDVADDVSPLTGSVPVFYRENDTTYTASPTHLGIGGAAWGASSRLYEYLAPEAKRQIFLQDASFTRQVNSEDSAFRLPTSVTSTGVGLIGTSGAGTTYTKTLLTTYQHDLAKWVIGQVATESCSASLDCSPTKEISRTDYDTNDLPWKTYAFGLPQQTIAYDFTVAGAYGTVKSVTDGRGYAAAVSNWKRGIPQLVNFPTSVSLSATVDNSGAISDVTNELSSQTCYGYDGIGRLNLITYNPETLPPSNACSAATWAQTHRDFTAVAATEYGIPTGHWKQTVSTGNGRTTTYYDARWQPVLTFTEDTANALTRSFVVNRYDVLGRKTFTSYHVGTLTSVNDTLDGIWTDYDALSRVVKVRQDSEQVAPYNATKTEYLTGFQTKVTNPRQFATTTRYQAYDSPSTDSPVQILLPEGVTTTIARQPALGKPVTVTRSGTYGGTGVSLTRSYVYDANERPCQTINPETGATIVDYDLSSNVLWSAEGQTASGTSAASCAADRTATAAGVKTIRAIDPMNRVTQLTTPGNIADITTTYAPDGLPATLVTKQPGTDTVTNTYTYNRRRLLTRETVQVNALLPWGFDYTYDGNAHLNSQTYPGSLLVGYAPDALGRPTQAGTFASGVTYYPNGAMSGFNYGNGIVHSMTQNRRKLPIRSVDANGATAILDDTYAYDPNGNVLSLVDASNALTTDNRTWGVQAATTYDGLDRLLSVRSTNQWGTAAYTYDPLDNLMSSRLVAGVTSGYDYTYNRTSNLLTSLARVGGGTYAYTTNPVGDITADGRQAYQFDAAHRMSAVTGKESYLYDGNGRRARTLNSSTGTIEYFGYGLDGRLLQDWSNRRGVRNAYIYLGNTLVALYEVNITTGATASRYKHTDALGSPVVTTDLNKVVLNRSAYTPYGVPVAPVDGVGYTGHFIDVGTQLTYMQQRYYDPQVGRFLSRDPAATEFNNYSYASDNPFRFVDPDGRLPKATSGGCGGNLECRVAQDQAEKDQRDEIAQTERSRIRAASDRFSLGGVPSPKSQTVEVIFWSPAGHGRSSLGHVSIRIGGISYSFAHEGMDVRKFSEYRAKQLFRSGTGYVLHLSPREVGVIQGVLEGYSKQYNYVPNNCTTPIQDALMQATGFGVMSPGRAQAFTPQDLENAILGNFETNTPQSYPKGIQ